MMAKFLVMMMLAPALAAGNAADEAKTQCDPALPFSVSLVPLDRVEAGREIRLQVKIDSSLDPDLVRSARLEYEFPAGFRNVGASFERREIRLRRGPARTEVGVRIPDESRHEVRARLVVNLGGGRTISQTASCWIDAGEPDPPSGMTGRIQDADGAGVRVYQGVTAKGRR